MNYNTTIRPGDLLLRPKALGFVNHVGVAVAPNLVLQNTPEKGEHLATLQEFSAGKPVNVLRTGAYPAMVAARAQSALANPQRYHVFLYNCEHTASKIIQGIARSPQLAFFAVMTVVVLLVLIFSRR
jgi:hypothetical protein